LLYQVYEFNHALVQPLRAAAGLGQLFLRNPMNPLRYTLPGRSLSAALDVFESSTRRYGKPQFGLTETRVAGRPCPVEDHVVWRKPFCNLRHFVRDPDVLKQAGRQNDPRLLVVAPLSGHYATLLRGTVEALLPHYEVYITDWADARMVPIIEGRFDVEDYTDYVIEILHFMGPGSHVMAVCQPSVPVLAATAVMSMAGDPDVPATLTLMGGPVDTRRNPTVPNKLATSRPIEWFEKNVILPVPPPYPGVLRQVYPGFMQLTGFMTMNLDRHLDAHHQLFWDLVDGDGDGVEDHRKFYDEYLAVMDLTVEFYLGTVKRVFQEQQLARGLWQHRGRKVDPRAITKPALLCVEGERDDISGLGQTAAALDLCEGIPDERKQHYVQLKVGHYGVFNGSRWRNEIRPAVSEFIRKFNIPA
jgi:poly(3-hydroxybutyrate) depolymerase